MKYLSNIGHVALRELDILRKNRIYGFCMIVFPLLLVFFFTTMLDEGIPQDLPVGVIDQDNSATSHGLIRNLDAMQRHQGGQPAFYNDKAFIRTLRLKQAANLLTTQNMNITEVVYACGFSNPTSFSTLFKSVYGMSPREYMKEHHK